MFALLRSTYKLHNQDRRATLWEVDHVWEKGDYDYRPSVRALSMCEAWFDVVCAELVHGLGVIAPNESVCPVTERRQQSYGIQRGEARVCSYQAARRRVHAAWATGRCACKHGIPG